MKNTKRFLTFLLAAATTLSLAACGGSGDGGSTGVLSGGSTANVSNTDLLKLAGEEFMEAGTLTEHEGYSILQIDGVDWDAAMSYSSDLFGELNAANYGFHHNEADGLEKATAEAGSDSARSEKLRPGTVVYVYQLYYDDTVVFLAGDDVPDERERWRLAGAPEEELPDVKISSFDGDSVAEFIPVCDSIDMTARDYNGQPEEDLYMTFYLSGLSMEQVNDYIQAARDMGYEEIWLGDMGNPSHDTLCFEGQLPNKVSIHLYYCDGTLMTSVLGPSYGPGDPWSDLFAYLGYAFVDDHEPSFNEQLAGGLWVDICWDELMNLYSGDALGKGTGTSSIGYVFWDMVNASAQDFRSCLGDVQNNGFTAGAESGDNYYTAYKNIDYEGNELTLWSTVCLKGDYLFCSVGLGKVSTEEISR